MKNLTVEKVTLCYSIIIVLPIIPAKIGLAPRLEIKFAVKDIKMLTPNKS